VTGLVLVRPDWEGDGPAARSALALRAELRPAPRITLDTTEPLVLGLIDNRKPNANRLLRLVAQELGARLPISGVEVLSKPASSRPIEPHEAVEMAARAHLVITGVGD